MKVSEESMQILGQKKSDPMVFSSETRGKVTSRPSTSTPPS